MPAAHGRCGGSTPTAICSSRAATSTSSAPRASSGWCASAPISRRRRPRSTLADRHPDVYAAVGLHPHDASKLAAEWTMLEPLAVSDACIAIGECGFDLFYEHSPRDEQETAFRFQIRLAKHTRQAARHPFARRLGRHVPRARRRRCARAHDLPLLHGRSGRSGRRARARLLPVVQRHRLVQERRRPARGGPAHSRRSRPRRDRLAVPHARAVPRQAERARARRRGRRRAGARGVEPDEIAELTRANAVRVFGVER